MGNIYIIGRGAIGSALAAQWQDKGSRATFICDPKRKNRYMNEKFNINGRSYFFTYTVPGDLETPADIIFLSVKYHHLDEICSLIEDSMGEDTLIVSLLNGVDSEEILALRFGEDRIVNAMIKNIDATMAGSALTFTRNGIIVFGDRTGKYPRNVPRVKQALEAGNISYEIEEDILQAQWWKFMVNVGVNQVSALLKARYRKFQGNKDIQILARSAMEEVVAIAGKSGINLLSDDIDTAFAMLADYSPDGMTSMLQDVEGQRKTEVEMLSGVILRLGQEINIPTPVNRVLFHAIKAMESEYLADSK